MGGYTVNYYYLITGIRGRNSVIAAFVFSLLLLAWSFIDAPIVVFVFLRSKVYDVSREKKSNEAKNSNKEEVSSAAKSSDDVSQEKMSNIAKSDDDVSQGEMSSAAKSDDSDDDQPHKSIEQSTRFGFGL